jgi:hypothetical protein
MKQEPAEVILQNQQGTVGILALLGREDVNRCSSMLLLVVGSQAG